MMTGTKYAPRRPATPALALAVLLVAGCSSGNVGESWQCPLAKGGSCSSVAAADPAVPDAGAAGKPLLREPLWRVRPVAEEAVRPGAEAPCEARCDGGFDPFGWLMRLFGAEEPEGEPPPAHVAGQEPATAPPSGTPRAEPAAAALPAEADPAHDDPVADDLRTGEVVARIWIAPFIDADGVYREASHVRVVLEPAGWRLPR